MKYTFNLIAFIFVVYRPFFSFACSPVIPANTNWLNFSIEIPQSSRSSGISVTIDGMYLKLESNKEEKVFVKTRYGDKQLPFSAHILDIVDLKLVKGVNRTVEDIPPQKNLPPDQPFEIKLIFQNHISIYYGKIKYARNPLYDPNIAKNWKDPCGKGW